MYYINKTVLHVFDIAFNYFFKSNIRKYNTYAIFSRVNNWIPVTVYKIEVVCCKRYKMTEWKITKWTYEKELLTI